MVRAKILVASFHLLLLLCKMHDAFYPLQKGEGAMISYMYYPQATAGFLPLLPPAPGSGAAVDCLPLNLGAITQPSLTGHLPVLLYVLLFFRLHSYLFQLSLITTVHSFFSFALYQPSLASLVSCKFLLSSISPKCGQTPTRACTV